MSATARVPPLRRALALGVCLAAAAVLYLFLGHRDGEQEITPAPPVQPQTGMRLGDGVLTGVVQDEDGTPVAGATVEAWRQGPSEWGPWTRRKAAGYFQGHPGREHLATTTTAGDGTWRITGLPEADILFLRAVGTDGRTCFDRLARAFAVERPPVALEFVPTVALHARLVDHDGRPLRGRIVCTATPRPPRPLVQRVVPSMHIQVATDAQGRFEVRGSPGAALRLTARVPGLGERTWTDLELPDAAPSEEVELPLREAAGYAVAGIVRGAGGSPVAGARVIAVSTTQPRSRILVQGAGCAVTDGEGRYRIEYLPGRHLTTLVVDGHGFALRVVPGTSEAGGAGTPLPDGRPFQADVLLGMGRTVRGRVVDEHDRGLADVEISFVPDDGQVMWQSNVFHETTSDAQGYFALTGLPYRRGRVVPTSPTHYLASRWDRKGPYGHWLRAAQPEVIEDVVLRMAAGEVREVVLQGTDGRPIAGAVALLYYHRDGHSGAVYNVAACSDDRGRVVFHGLPPLKYFEVDVDAPGYARQQTQLSAEDDPAAPPPVVAVPRSGRISGRVVDRDGAPMPGMPVRRPQSSFTETTDGAGRFTLDRLPPGTQHLIVAGPGTTIARGERVLELGEGDALEDVEIRCKDAPSTSDLVIAGRVVDEEGRSVPGQLVEADRVGTGAAHLVAWSDDQGRFRFEHVPEGRYTLSAGVPGRRRPVVEAGATDLRLEVPTLRTHVLEGVVLDPAGSPVPSGILSVTYPGDGPNARRHVAPLFLGRFRVSIPADRTRVHVQVTSPRDAEGRGLDVVDAPRAPLRIGPDPVEIRLRAAVAIEGSVQDDAGQPAPGLVLSLDLSPNGFLLPGRPLVETDEQGRFAFRGLPPGSYKVHMTDTPAWEVPAPVEVVPPEPALRLTVRRRGTIPGRLLDASGDRIADVRVYAWARTRTRDSDPRSASAQSHVKLVDAHTDAEGRFLLKGLSRTYVYDVHVNLPEALRVTRFVPQADRLEADGTELELRLKPGATITGRVVIEGGVGLRNATVRTLGPMGADGRRDAALSAQAHTNEQGRFEVGPLPEDAVVELYGAPPGNGRPGGTLHLPARVPGVHAGARDLTVQLTTGEELRGSVEGVTAEEMKWASLALEPTEGRGRFCFQFDGTTTRFRFTGLAPGRYVLRVQRPRGVELPLSVEVQVPGEEVVLSRIVRTRLTGRLTGVDPRGFRARFVPLADARSRVRPREALVHRDGTFDLGTQPRVRGVLVITHRRREYVVYMPLTPSGEPVAATAVRCQSIRGHVAGLPAKLIRGRIAARRGPIVFEGAITPEGDFEIAGLPPGQWKLDVSAYGPAGGSFEAPEHVAAGTTDVVVRWR